MVMKSKPTYNPNHLVCPVCFEVLGRDDIEGFGCCPYCNHPFDLNSDLEDFLLRPVVKQWMQFTRQVEEMESLM